MAAGQYSAGTIFLQVVPVFRDTMDKIQDESRKLSRAIGDDLEESGREGGKRASKAYSEEMEKGASDAGDKAGKKYAGAFETSIKKSITSAQKEIDRLDFSTASDKSIADLDRVKRKLAELKDVDFSVDFNAKKVLADVAIIEGAVKKMASGDHEINITANAQKVLADLQRIGAAAEAVEKKRRELNFVAKADFTPVERKMGAFEKKFRASMARATDSLGDNLGPKVAKIRAELESLSNIDIGIDMDAGTARAKALALKAELEAIAGTDVDIDVDIDLGAAIAQIAYLDHSLEKVERQSVKTAATVGIMGAIMAAFQPRANAAGSAGENAANSFRSFNFVILAAATLLPALVPVLAAVGGGLLALIPILGALGASLGVAILGFSGIGGALKEMGNVADEQAKAADKAEQGARSVAAATHAVADAERALADARRNAARAAADAERAVADARRNAARAIEAAYDRQREAADAYKDAQDAVREAEEDLRAARQEAADDAAGLGAKQRQNAVDERQAVLDLFQAQTEYNAVMADGSSTNTDKEQASVNLEQAQIALNGIRQEQADLAGEQADFAKNGVDGSDKVKSAQEQLTEALEAQADAQEAVTEAAKETRQVQADAARDVADALRNQRRTAADSARAIEDAQRALARAHEGQAQAVTDAANEGTAAMDRLEVAMSKLSPAGRRFARFLFGLRDEFRAVRDEVQERMLPGIQRGMQALIDEYGPKFKTFAGNVGESLGSIGENTGKGLGNEAWQKFFRTYGKLVPKLTEDFAAATGNWMTGFAGLFTTIAPFSERLSDGLLKMSERAERFFNSAKGKKEVTEFMEYAFKVGPDVVDFFKDLAVFAKDLAKALAPLGDMVLQGLNSFMEWISSLDPKTLQFIVTGVLGLVIAFQLAVGAFALVAAGGAALASPISAVIFIVVALATVLIALYQRFPVFRKIVDAVIKAVVKAFKWLRDFVVDEVVPRLKSGLETVWGAIKTLWEIAKPYITFLGELFTDVFNAVVWVVKTFVLPILSALWNAVIFLWDKVVKPYLGFIIGLWTEVFKQAWWVIKNIVLPVLDLLGHAVMKVYRDYIKPYFQGMKEAWETFSTAVRDTYNTYIKPALDALADYIGDHVKPKFETAVGLIKGIWAGLQEAFAAPVRFLINTVINDGLIAGFNWVAKKVGSSEIDPISLPGWAEEKTDKKTARAKGGMLPWGNQSRAVGGTLPGYNPGRDNYTFYNPQLGQLNLGGGEGILRPEVVRAGGGAEWIDSLNHAAIRGGVQGVQKKLYGSYWLGGVLPLAGASVSSHGSSYSYPAFDMNWGSAYDDYGRPVVAWKDGVALMHYMGDDSYGRYVTINHGNQTSLYAHLSAFAEGLAQNMRVMAGQTIGYVGDLGNTGTPPTSHLHFEIRGGAPDFSDTSTGGGGGPKIPGWASSIISKPLAWAKGLINKPLASMREKFGSNDLTKLITGVPMELAHRVGDYVKEIIPAAWGGLSNSFLGTPKHGDPQAPGQESSIPGQGPSSGGGTSLWRGGVLPYNGTMKYDAGGLLPPGLTNVVNLTGKPEPVFTADQFSKLDTGAGESGITYAPTFHGTNLTPAAVVDDLDFALRKVRREGRYQRNKL